MFVCRELHAKNNETSEISLFDKFILCTFYLYLFLVRFIYLNRELSYFVSRKNSRFREREKSRYGDF